MAFVRMLMHCRWRFDKAKRHERLSEDEVNIEREIVGFSNYDLPLLGLQHEQQPVH